MQSDRRGAAQSALRSVQARHDAIQKIERDIIELSQLFQDLDQLVMEQEPLVQNIEQKAEETKVNVDQGTQQLDTAITSARARNRKKWYCLGIVILIIIIVVVVAVVVVEVNKSSAPKVRCPVLCNFNSRCNNSDLYNHSLLPGVGCSRMPQYLSLVLSLSRRRTSLPDQILTFNAETEKEQRRNWLWFISRFPYL